MATAAKPQELKLHQEVSVNTDSACWALYIIFPTQKCFCQIENRMAVKRAFSSAVVYSKRLPKGKVDLMVLFMMDKHDDLFKVSGFR